MEILPCTDSPLKPDLIFKCILLMSGEGNRFNHPLPKQFHALSGKKVYVYALETCIAANIFSEIILVCHPQWIETVQKEVRHPSVKTIPGGKTRQESSYLGLLNCGNKTDFVVIHDAIRPFMSQELLMEHCKRVKIAQALDTCIPTNDTMIKTLSPPLIHEIPKRSELLRGQTPQSFDYSLILKAHQQALRDRTYEASDDCQLVLRMGHPVEFIYGDEYNVKITTELDLYLAEQIFRFQRKTKLNPELSLKGKKYIVAGGTGGIGKEICIALKKEGAFPLSLSPSSKEFPVDLTSSKQAKKIFEQIGYVDGIINTMGFLRVKSFKKCSLQELKRTIAVNYFAPIFVCKFAKIHPNGHIINLSSSSFTKGRKQYALYSSTKAAIVNFTQALAEEHPELYINSIIPKRTNTSLRTKNFSEEDPLTLLSPKNVAEIVIDLLKSKKITGTIIEVR